MSDTTESKIDATTPIQSNTDASWFFVENGQEDKDLLKARTWDVSRRIIDDSTTQGNLHYGSGTQQDLIQDNDATPSATALSGVSGEAGEIASLADQEGAVEPAVDADADADLATDTDHSQTPTMAAALPSTGISVVTETATVQSPSIPASEVAVASAANVQHLESGSEEAANALAPQATIISGSGGALVEDETMAVSGTLTIRDANEGEAGFIAASFNGSYGSFSIDASGVWTYTLANDQLNVQALKAGEIVSDIFTVSSIDGTSHCLSMTITGTNDAPMIVAPVDLGSLAEDQSLFISSAQLLAQASDIEGDALSVSQLNAVDADGKVVGTFTAATADGVSGFLFTPNKDFNGDAVQISYQISDGTASTEARALIDVTAVNDQALIGGTRTGTVVEDGARLSGSLTISDVDSGEAHFQAGDIAGQFGTLTIDAAGNWSYALDNNNPEVQALGAGDQALDSITVVSADGTEQTITLTITGSNDGAIISGDTAANLVEDQTLTASGSLSISDADYGEALFAAGDIAGQFGSLTIDAQGNWSYALENDNPEVQALGIGDQAQDSITVVSADGTEQTITLTITGSNDAPVVSAGTTPIAASEDTAIVLRPEQLLAQASDVDGDALSITNVHVTSGGTIPVTLKISGDHYDPKNIENVGAGSPKFQVSVNGQLVEVDGQSTFTVEAVRGQWEYFTVNVPADTVIESVSVRFVNDAYDSVDNDKDGKLYEDRNLIVDKINIGGQVTATGSFTGGVTMEAEKAYYDSPKASGYETMAWNGSLQFDVSAVTPSAYSPLTANADGTYTLNPGANYNGTIQLSYDVVDGQGGTTSTTATIQVAAVNDQAVIGGATSGTIAEDATKISGKLTVEDVDSGEAHFQAGSVQSEFGTLTIDAAGNWSYTLDNSNTQVQQLGVGEQAKDSIVVKSADGTEQTISLTITGSNDGPVASNDILSTDLGDRVAGAASGVEITGIYRPGSTVNLLDGIDDPLTTLSGHQYFEHNTFGNTGYNYMGGHNWFVDHNIDLSGLTGGVITFSDGTSGVIDTAYNGVGTRADGTVWNESAYIYYRAYEEVEIGGTVAVGEDMRLTLNTSTLLENDQDVDGDTLSVTGVQLVDTTQGTLSLANGQISFVPGNALDRLDDGEATTVQFTYTISDGHGGSASAMAEFTVLGTNDRPVVSAPVDLGSIDEDRSLFISTNQLLTNATDIDGETLGVSQLTATDANGKVAGVFTAATENGVSGFLFTPASNFNGDNVQISYRISDGTAATEASATIDVAAVNDHAVIGGSTTGTIAEDTAAITGQLTITDVDSGEASFLADTIHGSFGTLTIDAQGSWSYALDNSNAQVQALGSNEKAEDTLTVKAADGTEQTLTLTITGTNDAPVVSAGAAPIAASEDTAIVIHPEQLLAQASDVDGDALAITNVQITSGGTIPVTLKISGDHYDPKNIQDVGAGSPKFQVSVNGQLVEVDGQNTFTVEAVHGQWEYFTVNVPADTVIESVSVRFVNDAYDSTDNDKDGKLNEDRNLIVDKINIGGQLTDTGTFAGGVTLEAEKAYYDTPKASGYEVMPWSGSLKFDVSAVAPAAYSPLTPNADGTYTLNPGANYNDTIQLSYDVVDGQGGITTATATIEVAAANDQAIVGGTTSATIVEDASKISGKLTVENVDSGEAYFQAGSMQGSFGTLSIDAAGNWSYALDNSNTQVQQLGVGEQAKDSIIVKTADGTEQTISLTITGSNDGPVASNDALPTASFTALSWGYEDGGSRNSGVTVDGTTYRTTRGIGVTLLDADGNVVSHATFDTYASADNTAQFVAHVEALQSQAEAGYQVVITTHDEWTLNMSDQGLATLRALGADDALLGEVETHNGNSSSYRSSYLLIAEKTDSGWEQSFEDLHLRGSDAPIVADDTTVMSGNNVTLDVLANDSDIDGDNLSIAQINGQDASQGQIIDIEVNGTVVGTAQVVDGKIAFTQGEALTSLQNGESATVQLQYTVSDGQGGNDEATADIKVVGVNDGPVAKDDSTGFTALSSGFDDTGSLASGVTVAGQRYATTRGVGVTVIDANNVVISHQCFDTYANTGASSEMAAHIEQAMAEADTGCRIVITTHDEWVSKMSSEGLDTLQSLGGSDAILGAIDSADYRSSYQLVVSLTENGWQTLSEDFQPRYATSAITAQIGVDEDSPILIDVLANDRDADGDTLAITQVSQVIDADGTVLGVAEVVDGKVQFTPGDALDALAEGEQQQVSFTYTVDDGQGGSATATTTFTVMGTNDAAIVAGQSTGTVGVDGATETTGTLQVEDADHGQAQFQAEEFQGSYGSLTIDENGAWQYSLDTNSDSTQALEQGETADDVFVVQTADGTEQSITISVQGISDEEVPALGLSAMELPSFGDEVPVDEGNLEQAAPSSPEDFLVTDATIDDISAMDESIDSPTEVVDEISAAGLDVQESVTCEPEDPPPPIHPDTLS